MLALSYLEPCATICSSCRPSSVPKEVFINPSCIHMKQRVHLHAPALASVIAPTRVCDCTFTRVKGGSHASDVLITHVSHACHSHGTRMSHASVNYVASELYCILRFHT